MAHRRKNPTSLKEEVHAPQKADTTALIIPPERLKTEADLRSEICNLEARYERLKKTLDILAGCTCVLEEEFKEKLFTIAAHEKKLLDSFFRALSEELKKWLVSESEFAHMTWLPKLDPRELEKCKKFLWMISEAAHPDKDKVGKYADLMKEATMAYKRGDLATLEKIAKEIEYSDGRYSRRLYSAPELLEKERDALAFLVADLEKSVSKAEFAGVRLARYLQDGAMDINGVKQAVEASIDSELAKIECRPPKTQEEPVVLSEINAVVEAAGEKGLWAFSDEEKERIIKGKVERILQRANRISPYYNGLDGSTVTLDIKEIESSFSPLISIGNEQLNYVRMYMEVPKSALTCITIGGIELGLLHCFLSVEGDIIVPKEELENFARASKILAKVESVLSQPLRNLTVAYDNLLGSGHSVISLQIIGCYEEYNDPRIKNEYCLDSFNEMMLNRLIRAMLLLKIPRRYEYEEYSQRYLYSENLQMSFPYPSDGGKKEGESAEMAVELDGEERNVDGKIFEMKNRDEVFGGFRKLMFCDYVEFEGTLEMDGEVLPFRMTFNSLSPFSQPIHSFVHSIKKGDGFELFISVAGKDIFITYKTPSRSPPILKVKGIPEELLPELVFQIIETLRVERVRGEAEDYHFEYM